MLNEFLTPVSAELKQLAAELDAFTIGGNLSFDDEFSPNSFVIVGVKETRGGELTYNDELSFDEIRRQFYQLKKGNWHMPMVDLGDLNAGATIGDTYYAIQKIQEEILRQKGILIVLGGSSDLIYHQYRAFDSVKINVNLSIVDNRFRLGVDSDPIDYSNYLSKIIATEPHNLFEYCHYGYQTYFVAQEELDLMEHLNFDVKRLGKLTEAVNEAEPEFRNSDLVALNLESIQSSDFKSSIKNSPNGFNAREICALSRYAGINQRVQSFGLYNYKSIYNESDDLLVAEVIWYFIEGKNQAPADFNISDLTNFEKFYVQIPEQDLTFYHNLISDQWWLELQDMNDAVEGGAQVVPCSAKDYQSSLEGKIPDRWWKSYKKLY